MTAAAENLLRAVVAPWAFLTRLPVGRLIRLDGDDVGRGSPLFPLVGAALGATSAFAADLLEGPLSPLLAAALAVTLTAILTGAMHLDALADTVDAIGARSRPEALRIMRDGRIGAFGAAALALAILLRVAAFAALVTSGGLIAAATAAGACSRAMPLPLAALLPYLRPEGGQGTGVSEHARFGPSLAGTAVAAGLALLVLGGDALIALGVAGIVLGGLWFGYRRWLGGITGDMLGAAIEMAEIAVLTAIVAA